MKIIRNIIGVHISLFVLCSVIYTLIIWMAGQLFPSAAAGYPVIKDSRLIGYENIGQKFSSDKYFWGRPSASDYNARASQASNMGPNNPIYLHLVKTRIDTFLIHNPGVKKTDIPVEMITTSGSGLDPHISVNSALIQIPRISRVRAIQEIRLKELVIRYIEKPVLGFLGTEKVNVLKLNMGLDAM